MKLRVYILYGAATLFLLSGCAGTGERIPVSFSYKEEAPSSSRTSPSQQKVVVFPLEDKREDPKTVGRHVHLSGRVDTYVPKSLPARHSLQLLIASLRSGLGCPSSSRGVRPQDKTDRDNRRSNLSAVLFRVDTQK
jgi:hypothetical protein